MNQRRLINKLLSVTLIISLTLGCNFLSSLFGTPDPNQEIINTAIQDSQSVSMEAADQAEQDMLDLLREQSGARAAFGDQANAIFQQIDQDRSTALEEMMNRARGAVNSSKKVSALIAKSGISGTTRAPLDKENYLTKSMVQAFMILLGAPEIANLERDDNGNAIGPKTEGGDPVGAAGAHYSFQPKLIGSRLDATGTITITIKDPFPYEESVEYTLSMELCPDAQGNVPIQLSFKSSVGLLGGGVQLGVDSQVTGHVNDEGTLDSRNSKSTYQGARQPIQGVGDNLGTANTYFEFQEDFTLYENPDIPPSTDTEGYTRQSSETDKKFNQDTIQEMRLINGVVTNNALNTAEKKWTSGYCVEVQVPGLGAGGMRVQPNSETPFTAKVRHKFENTELNVPVIATLSDGQVSVNPSGSKVPAPAKFIYTAPDKSGQKATVHLETRSKRGVATLDVTFTTGETGWKIPLSSTFSGGLGAGECTGWLSCGSPYGPWDITCELTSSLVKTTVKEIIPFSEDGKTTATREEHQLVTDSQSGQDSLGNQENVTITPNSGGYQINFPAIRMVGKLWVIDSLGNMTVIPIDKTEEAFVLPIVPADPGECPQP